MNRRWHVCKVGARWAAHPADVVDLRELTVWPFWEDALAHAAHMAGLDRMEVTA